MSFWGPGSFLHVTQDCAERHDIARRLYGFRVRSRSRFSRPFFFFKEKKTTCRFSDRSRATPSMFDVHFPILHEAKSGFDPLNTTDACRSSVGTFSKFSERVCIIFLALRALIAPLAIDDVNVENHKELVDASLAFIGIV